jgi:hypothetical protein
MPRSAYTDFVSQYASANRPTDGWKKGQLMTEAGAAWRAAGHTPKVRVRSECVGKQQSSCLPPCSWAQGAKRQYCRKPASSSPRATSPRATSPRATSPRATSPRATSPTGPAPVFVDVKKRKTRPILAPALHSCAGLGQDPCDVAPNCYWQASNKRCVTRSGKEVKQMYQGNERQDMLAQIRGSERSY